MMTPMRLLAVAIVIALDSGCGSDPHAVAGGKDAPEEKVLYVYNWADYIGKSTLADFERAALFRDAAAKDSARPLRRIARDRSAR